ncbi:MAG: hypothetical protein C0596_10610 [Marinilabiliales bacterium]|nr:MAG: hypothetical protein C0596_10610 [Marinilabiliales bacterium]
MKKSFLLLISVILMNFAFAQTSNNYYVSAEDAQQIGSNFHAHQAAKLNPVKYNNLDQSIKSQATLSTQEGLECMHVFNFNQGGFVLVSADMRATPVMAYSFEGEFDYNNMAPSTKSWIEDNYMVQFEIINESNMEVSESVLAQWESIRHNYFSFDKSVKGTEPLIETRWNQDWPYNMFCPEHPEGPGGHTYAGCVATTMSQVMKFWNYPEIGRGEYEYFWGDYVTSNFGETEYRWEEMTETATTNSREAIAELMYHCGVSVDMGWGYDGSGTQTEYAVYSMKQFFRYRTGIYAQDRDTTQDDVWKLTLKEEIDKGHPIIYSGNAEDGSGGHAFVCDAYQDTSYFHFNWGWGGYNDGYFNLDDMTPGGDNDFSYWQGIVTNITTDYADYCAESTIYTQPEWTFGDGSGDNYYFNDTYCDWLIDPEVDDIYLLRLTFTKFDLAENDVLKVYKGSNVNPSLTLVGEYTSANRPYTIDNWNGDRFYLVFETDGTGQADGLEASYTTYATEVEVNELTGISLYPNPANGTININGITNSDVVIYDIYGKQIKEFNSINSTTIDISDMSNGVYLMNISNKDGVKTLKFVKN